MAYRSTKPALTDSERAGCIYIQQNFATLNQYYTVNHADINTDVGHSFLQFYPIANPTTPSADEFVMFGRAGVYGALNAIEMCIRRQSNGDINEFTSKQTGDEGWFQLPSGILIKWKWNYAIPASSTGLQIFTWDNAANFPSFSAIYQSYVWVSPDVNATDPNVEVYAHTPGLTNVQWLGWNRNQNGATPTTTNAYKVNIIAIGKGPGV